MPRRLKTRSRGSGQAESRRSLRAMFGEFFFAAVTLMVWVERIPFPRLLHRPLEIIASSTLFIYILHTAVVTQIMPKLHLPAWLPLEVMMMLGFGIAANFAWHRLMRM